jgi:hypothetical protein
MKPTSDVDKPTRTSRLANAQRWIVPAMLLALHGALLSEPGGAFMRTWMLVHFGLFLLWQPFVSTHRRIEPFAGLLLLVIVAVTVGFLAPWMIVAWLLILLGILGGRVFTTPNVARERFYLLAFGYLLTVMLLWGVPNLLLGQPVPEYVGRFASLVLPWALVLLVFLPTPRENPEGQLFDFFYAVMVFQLGLVLVLGSLAAMRFTGQQYFISVAVTASGFGIALFVLAVLWSPVRGFGGLRTYFSRYLLSVGMPFELWMRRIAELAETEPDSRRFLELSVEELARLPWIRGGRWRSPDGEAVFGEPEGAASPFSHESLEMVLYTRHALSPALALHIRLLARVIGQFYEAKRREMALRHSAYLQATHETGARLTHDVKNLLQSLYALMSAAPRDRASDGYAQLLQRQLPQLTQRLNATLEKLRSPESATTELPMPAREWWSGIERRFAGSGITLEATIEADRSIPAPLFDSFVENGIENARAKAERDPRLAIAVKFTSTGDRIEVEVADTGGALAPIVAERVFRSPIERDTGLGIGLFHLGRQAAGAGYRAALASNVEGDVRFRLSLER